MKPLNRITCIMSLMHGIKPVIHSTFSRISDFLAPHRCLHCGNQAPFSSNPALCTLCSEVYWSNLRCTRCGRICDASQVNGCHRCRGRSQAASSFQSLGPHQDWLRHAILGWKYRRDELCLRYLRNLSASFRRDEENGEAALTYVSSSKSRMKERKCHTQHLPPLLQQLAKTWGMSIIHSIEKKEGLEAQVHKGGKARRDAVAGTLSICADKELPTHLYVFDDVWTTGSTLREAARVLKKAGVITISLRVFAQSCEDDE